MDVTVSELMADFMESPLVVWAKTFGPLASNSEDKLSMYMELVDGVFLHKIMTHIDPNPSNRRVNKQVNNDVNLRIQNLNTVIRHIRNYYQENLQQLILMSLPNVLTIAKDPLSGKSMEEMKRILLLLLGCAVQCERKEEIIEKIKLLDIETQAAIVSNIQEVTHNQENVLDMQWLEVGGLPPEDLDPLSRTMALHLRKLIDERDENSELILELTQERDYLQLQQLSSAVNCSRDLSFQPSILPKEERQHLAVELADTKAKLRRSRQQLEEKTEQLIDAKNELERLDAKMQKLKQENLQLLAEVRSVRVYRDELDVLRERDGKVDRLETELARFKEKLHDVHFYKARMEELREDNMTLLETKAMLEEQLGTARGRCDKLHELEKENLHLRSKLHDMEIDRDSDKKRLEELLEENMILEISQKQSMNESAHLGWELEQLSKNNEVNGVRKSFVVEMNESASSRLLKLEKENQSLQSTIQNLREATLSLEEGKLHTMELKRENQGLSEKLERLQTQLDQEKQTTKDIENLSEDLIKEKQRLEKNLENLSADKEKQISELEREKKHLRQTVNSLQKPAQEDTEAHLRGVETENRILHQKISDKESQMVQLENEKQEIIKHLEGERECATELQKTVKSFQKQLQDELTFHKVTEEQLKELRCKNNLLEQENWGLKIDTEELQSDNMRLTLLEKEHRRLESENAELQSTLVELRSQVKRTERLEIKCNSLDKENQQLQQSLETRSNKIQDLENELHEADAQSEELRHELEELRKVARCAEVVEKERRRVEQELGQAEKERKQLEREARRLRQQVDVKELALEENSLKLGSKEKEVTAMSREVARLQEVATKLKEMEKDNKELQKQVSIDKKTLVTLREELVNEKLRVQQQCNELEKLSHELDKIGLNREKLLQEEHSCEDNKYRFLETKIESALKNSLNLREEKIQSLESRLEESSSLNQQLRFELTSVKKTLEALRQRQEEEAAHFEISQKALEEGRSGTSQEKCEMEHREITAELLKLKDHLIDIEKNNASLQTEKQLLKEHLKQLDSHNTQLNTQTLALQKQATTLQEQNTALHKDTAKLQVENSTLKSQNSSLTAQYTALQSQLQTLEMEAEVLQREHENAQRSHDRITQDHEHLLSVHERQAAEYEQLISQHTSLKSTLRALEQEHRSLESKYVLLLKQKDAVEKLEVSLHRERENLNKEISNNAQIMKENCSLKEEMDRLSQTHTHLRQEYDRLQLQSKELKTSLNETQLELNRWQVNFHQLKEEHQGLDISNTKLDNHCELLTRLKGNLEEENHHLLSQIQMLSQQNQTLLERSMESKELYHEEQKQYIDKLNSLRRQKEKLEEKIMDQYKFYDPTPKKKSHWMGAKAIAKLMKPKKEGSRERRDGLRERIRSAPDIPLPDIPHPLECSAESPLPPLSAPPLPPRQTGLNLDSPSSLFVEENHTDSFSILPEASNHRGVGYNSGSRNSEVCRSTGGSTEDMNGYEELVFRLRALEPGVSCSTPLNQNSHGAPGFALSSTRPGRRPKGLGPKSAEYSRNTSSSSSSSPVSLKDSLEHLHRHSASLFNSEVAGLSHEISTLSQSPLPPCIATLPSAAAPQSRSAPRTTCPRPSSPGSEMVTLEEFLQESNTLTSSTVHRGSPKDLMTDSFTRANGPMLLIRDGAKTPTSYVTPTIKTASIPDGQFSKPGQSVKPSIHLTEAFMPHSQSQTLPNRGSSGNGGRSLHLQHSGPHAGCSSSLSRTFSLASADLLQSNSPDGYRSEKGSTMQAERVTRRECPLPVRPIGSSGYLSLDPRDLSITSPRDVPLLSSSSTALQSEREHTGSGGRSENMHTPPRGEVALVTPVRAVSVTRQKEVEEQRNIKQTEPSLSSLKKSDSSGPNCYVEERPISTPASPDPNSDQQTVWYEYGCV